MARTINQKPKQLFDIGSISDPAMRANFEVLNRELNKRISSEEVIAPNIAFSQGVRSGIYGPSSYGPDINTIHKIAGMEVSIQTKGNPVELMVVPLEDISSNGVGELLPSNFSFTNSVDPTVSGYFGCYRTTEGQSEKLLYRHFFSVPARSFFAYGIVITPPPFNYVDTKAPKGLHRYSFFWESGDESILFTLVNVCMMAKEMR